MKNLLLFFIITISLSSKAQIKQAAKPEIGFEAFVKSMTDSVVFPQEYYDNGGLQLRIAVDSLSSVKLLSIKPQNELFFDEVKNIVHATKWIPQKIDDVAKTSVFVLPIKLTQEMQQNVYKKAEPREGIRDLMNNFIKKLNIGKMDGDYRFLITLFISKNGDVTNVQCIPYDKNIYEQVKDYFSIRKWYPAIDKGVPVDSKFNLPITFKQN